VQHRSRLRLFVLQRQLLRVGLVALVLSCLTYVYLELDPRTLPNIRVAGVPLARTREPAAVLRPRAQAWGAQQIKLITGPHLTTATRKDLGASLEVDALAARLSHIGHTGNPVVDLWMWQNVLRRGMDVPWPPHIDRARLGRYMRAVRNVVEQPPVAGTSDQSGVKIAGVAGITLDTFEAAERVEEALRSGQLQLSVDLRPVPAPQAMEIGSPDGVDDNETEVDNDVRISAEEAERMREAMPKNWLPQQGCEPMDPPYEHFCQGPRQVPVPFGAAATEAERLDLGTLQAVGQLLNAEPRAEWVQAAGGPQPLSHRLLWPVNGGRLWRRFGYVRKPPFEHLLHRGLDVGAPKGSPLLAVNPGIVAYSDNRVRGYGNLLVIVHADGSVTFSAHCRAIYVFAGQHVVRGQIVGEVGDTGLARGPHVHWEYHLSGRAADPDGLFMN
jgi:murein DD-endopeptidase MepM/ murein hydrolase activator NlpD